MNEVISRRKVRTVAYLRIFVSQVINSRPLVWEICILRHTRWSFYIHYAFLIPPIRKWQREKRLNPNITARRKRSPYCVHCVATKIINLFLILNQSNAGFHRRTLEGCVQISNDRFKCKRRLRFVDGKPLPFFTGYETEQARPNKSRKLYERLMKPLCCFMGLGVCVWIIVESRLSLQRPPEAQKSNQP